MRCGLGMRAPCLLFQPVLLDGAELPALALMCATIIQMCSGTRFSSRLFTGVRRYGAQYGETCPRSVIKLRAGFHIATFSHSASPSGLACNAQISLSAFVVGSFGRNLNKYGAATAKTAPNPQVAVKVANPIKCCGAFTLGQR